MSDSLFRHLADWLADGPVVLASVLSTRGATPRKRGARMLIDAQRIEASVGGGLVEGRVIDAARSMLADSSDDAGAIELALDGSPDAVGVCGGRMRIALRRWQGEAARARSDALASALAFGHAVELRADEVGGEHPVRIEPDPRLLIIGAGHCGHALYQLARHLDFDIWVHDSRADRFTERSFDGAVVLTGEPSSLLQALDSERETLAVLLNRDFHNDIRSLDVLARRPPAFLGMMGSQRRIHEVRRALPELADALAGLEAPVGLPIGAETPHEIAVSILARLIQWRQARVAIDD
jgi:xanthine dehydrogenase accessory factor